MGYTGIVRDIDNLGRIVVPSEFRRALGIKPGGGSLEIIMEEDRVILRKPKVECTFCGSADVKLSHKNRSICAECAAEIAKGE